MDTIDDDDLAVYVVWVPRNGARERHVGRVTEIVTDHRATQYWDSGSVVADAYTEQLSLTGPCAGIFMVYPPGVRWDAEEPPRAPYLLDAHAREYRRPDEQFHGDKFSDAVANR